jgi:Na+/melibiose symporter-like transporter
MDMLKYTKFGVVNAAISLIPIFPTWSLFPGIMIATFLGDLAGKCEQGYQIVLWTCVIIAVLLTWWYLSQIHRWISNKNEKELKKHFRFFSLGVYTLLNTAILIMIIGTRLACHGDGQTVLACIVSGPIASVGLIILGFIVDLKKGYV